MPCKMELKVKDYEKFKTYYCGVCRSIKKQFGNLPRMVLNYDMTFLATLLDGLSDEKAQFKTITCFTHPTKKKIIIENNDAIDYAAYCNIMLTYYKLLDDAVDDNKLSHSILAKALKLYLKNEEKNKDLESYVKNRLAELSYMEKGLTTELNLDKIADPFANLTGFLISNYSSNPSIKEKLNFLGYNIGKWIYIIDAYDDLEKDMKENKFNPLNEIFNIKQLSYKEFSSTIEERISFTLTCCAVNAGEILEQLPLKKNQELLYNIIHLGLMEKMDKVFKRSEK